MTNLRDYYLQSTIHRVSLLYLGLNSVGEAVYAHVPMILLLGFADQPAMVAKVMEAKIGYAIERDLLTSEQLVFYIEIILQDYDSLVRRLIRIHQISELEGGTRQAAILIDGWLITGYTHLLTKEHQLPFLARNIYFFTCVLI